MSSDTAHEIPFPMEDVQDTCLATLAHIVIHMYRRVALLDHRAQGWWKLKLALYLPLQYILSKISFDTLAYAKWQAIINQHGVSVLTLIDMKFNLLLYFITMDITP